MENKAFELHQKDRLALLARKLPEKKKAAIIVLEGSGITGIQSFVSRLASILDPRHFRLNHLNLKTTNHKTLPFLYDYWKILPKIGDILILDRSWYFKLVYARLKGKIKQAEFDRLMHQFSDFETTLSDNSYLVYKLYIGMSEKRLKKYYDAEKNADWIMPDFIKNRYKTRLDNYKKFEELFLEVLEPAKIENRIHIPWKKIYGEKKKEIRGLGIQYLIEVLEKDLGVDSIKDVQEFDAAMEKMRNLSKGV